MPAVGGVPNYRYLRLCLWLGVNEFRHYFSIGRLNTTEIVLAIVPLADHSTCPKNHTLLVPS